MDAQIDQTARIDGDESDLWRSSDRSEDVVAACLQADGAAVLDVQVHVQLSAVVQRHHALLNSEARKSRVIAGRKNIRRYTVPDVGRYPKRAGAGLDEIDRREGDTRLRVGLAGQPAGQSQGT